MPDSDRDLIERVAHQLRQPVDIGAGFEAPVMARVLGERPARRPYRLVAAVAFGSLTAAAGLTLLVVAHRAPQPVGGRDETRPVRFELVAPHASSVAVVGDFNDWSTAGIPLSRASSGGRWTAIALLPPGHYNYAFVVDGTQWIPDPAAPRAAGDDFGRPNSVVTVGGSSL